MNFLIADDREEKQEALSLFMKEIYSSCNIVQTYAYNTTFEQIRKNKFDLIFLDMTMPSFDAKSGKKEHDRSLRTLAGRDIIIKMAYRKIKIPTLIVTQFEVFGRHNQITPIEEITNELMEQYPDIVYGCVLFDFQSDSWKSQLNNEISKVLK